VDTVPMKRKWETSALIDAEEGVLTTLCKVLFTIWALAGLLLNGIYFMSLPPGVGVGTSAYVAAATLFWIGGMVMFGFGALITGGSLHFKRPVDPT
jgi:hypothetical protein